MCLHALDGSIKYLQSLKHKREKLWSVQYDYKQEKKSWFDSSYFLHSANEPFR